MILSFFKALNPTSKYSGIGYPSYTVDVNLKGQEIIDNTILEQIKNLDSSIGASEIFNFLVGKHYSFGYQGEGSKGLLDLLIFPLISRVLINEFDNNKIIAPLALLIALPLEITRFSLAIGLTLLIAPIVTVSNLFSSCLSHQEPTRTSSKTTIPAPDQTHPLMTV